MIIRQYEYVQLVYDEKENDAVKFALTNLRRDLIRTLDCRVKKVILM